MCFDTMHLAIIDYIQIREMGDSLARSQEEQEDLAKGNMNFERWKLLLFLLDFLVWQGVHYEVAQEILTGGESHKIRLQLPT